MGPQIVETLNVTYAAAWLPWAVQYFFLIGLSYGAFVLSLPGIVLQRPNWYTSSRLALLIALISGLCAPVALQSDLHQPARFLNFYLHFQPTSWMAWGSVFLVFYVICLLLYSWLACRPILDKVATQGGRYAHIAKILACGGHESRRALQVAAALTLLGVIGIVIYTSAELMSVRARPLWHNYAGPLLFVFTGIASAAALTLWMNRFTAFRHDAIVIAPLLKVMGWMQLSALGVGIAWWIAGTTGLSLTAAQALQQIAHVSSWQMSAVWIGGATVLSLLLVWWRPGAGLVAGALVLYVAWMTRWTLLITGQTIPKTGAGVYSTALSLGFDGLLGIAGTLGLCVFLWVVVTSLVPLNRLNERA